MAVPAHADSLTQRAREMISKMTAAQKAAQLLHEAPAIDRVGVPEYNWWNECLHGVGRAGRATVFPQAIGLAATFNEPLVHRIGTVISDEARAKHHQGIRQGNRGQYFGLTYWTPNINIFRDPRWGRGQETYGEDPHLTARLGVALVRGLQGDDPTYRKLDATAKHYAVHSGPEPLRHGFDAIVSQRDLHETYLPAFKALVQEAHVASVMGAYNRVNGEACCASPTLLEGILRRDWGFDGYFVSDCGAICDFHKHHGLTHTAAESAAMALRNGCDLNCGKAFHDLSAALQAGLITEADLDRSLERLMVARLKLGMFDPPEQVPWSRIPPEVVGCAEHRELARQAARESVVLLRNEGNLLPLGDQAGPILVVGPTAFHQRMLQGNYTGFSAQMTTILEGVMARASVGTQVLYNPGCTLAGKGPLHKKLDTVLKDASVVIAVLGNTADLEGEEGAVDDEAQSEGGGDRVRLGLPGRQQELLERIHASGKPVVLVLTGGSPIELEWASQNIPAILMSWYGGEAGGQAVADVLYGDYNPAGRLPVTFVRGLEQLPAFENYDMAGRTYRFMQAQPRYRFGFGLSYTQFRYSRLELSPATIGPDGQVTVSADVTNVGQRAGDEVVQMYVRDVEASVPVPLRHLEGFQRVHLQPGQTQRVQFVLRAQQLACYDDAGRPMVEPGEFVISVGGGQEDDPASGALTAKLTVTGK